MVNKNTKGVLGVGLLVWIYIAFHKRPRNSPPPPAGANENGGNTHPEPLLAAQWGLTVNEQEPLSKADSSDSTAVHDTHSIPTEGRGNPPDAAVPVVEDGSAGAAEEVWFSPDELERYLREIARQEKAAADALKKLQATTPAAPEPPSTLHIPGTGGFVYTDLPQAALHV